LVELDCDFRVSPRMCLTLIVPLGMSMRVFARGPGWRVFLGVAASLVVGFLLAPSTAHGGCGEHVMLTKIANAGTPLPPDSHLPPDTSFPATPKRAPCSGPHCSRAPIAPSPTPVAPVAPGITEWACVLDSSTTLKKNSFSHEFEDPLETTSSLISSIYHPPR
jgi:hypothetical protein